MSRPDINPNLGKAARDDAHWHEVRWEELDSGLYSPDAVRAEFLAHMLIQSREHGEGIVQMPRAGAKGNR